MNREPLVHVGYPKTATTWLQQRLFVEDRGYDQPIDRHTLLSRVVVPDRFDFDETAVRAWIQGRLDAAASGTVPVISHERLAGKPYGDRLEQAEIAERIIECVPTARVLVVVREQRAMALAQYLQYVRNGGTLPVDEFIAEGRPDLGFAPFFPPAYLAYDRLVAFYRRHLGDDRVLVLPYEQLRVDRRGFVARINGFVGLEAGAPLDDPPDNVAWSAATYRLKRVLNVVARRHPARPLDTWRYDALNRAAARFDRALPSAGRRDPAGWSAQVERAVGDRYASSNRRLEELTGLDLRSLGYA